MVHEISNDSIKLKKVILDLWSNKFIIIITTLVFFTFSIFYSLSIPNEYRVEATLISSGLDETSLDNKNVNLNSGFNGILGSLTSTYLDGVSPETKIALEVLSSWSFIDDFIAKNNLAPHLLAAKRWDKTENKIIFDENIYDESNGSLSNLYQENINLSQILYKKFKNRLNIVINSDNGFINLSFDYFSPYLARKWLEKFIEEINLTMKNRASDSAKKNLLFLEKSFESTNTAETKLVISSLIKQQIAKQMLAEASPEYSFVYVSKIMTPSQKFKPRRSLIVIIFSIVGFLSSIFLIFAYRYFKNILNENE